MESCKYYAHRNEQGDIEMFEPETSVGLDFKPVQTLKSVGVVDVNGLMAFIETTKRELTEATEKYEVIRNLLDSESADVKSPAESADVKSPAESVEQPG
jgi:hypothetical protein